MARHPVSILIVDDDVVDVRSLRRAFSKFEVPYQVHVASDGLDGLRQLRSGETQRPILVLLDLHMPRMNGIEFLRTVRADPELHDLVIFVLTVSEADQDKVEAYKSHVAGFLRKGSLPGGFAAVATFVERYSKTVELPGGA